MEVGIKRTIIARTAAVLGFVCGLIGVSAGLTDHAWKLGAIGWFTGGGLLILIALYVALDATLAVERSKVVLVKRERVGPFSRNVVQGIDGQPPRPLQRPTHVDMPREHR